ncbi:hypothetical protein [Dactylosporangium salmoneum]|uniref:Anti-sigma factor n=1 Tax=Dactylosporangium salmoneum TaxID=53361 RepID=A0ABN3H3R7_9ACTN
MTAFSEADLDRLADFVGGALDGTPEADDVRHLVTTDTAWAEAYAALVAADATMRDELHALGAQAPAVPLEVQQRLDVALMEAVTAPPTNAPVVDLDRARQARRRRGRWIAGLAAAAAMIVCGGVGVQVIRSSGQDNKAQSSADLPNVAAAPDSRGNSAAGGSGASGPVISSGRDYGRGTLGDLTRGGTGTAANVQGAEGAGPGATSGRTSVTGVPGPLSRLAGPAARGACLAAITREYGGQVTLVDYAAFEGQPALVVVLDGTRVGAGKRLVVVVGPDCGIGGAIADERYRTIAP